MDKSNNSMSPGPSIEILNGGAKCGEACNNSGDCNENEQCPRCSNGKCLPSDGMTKTDDGRPVYDKFKDLLTMTVMK